MEEARMDLHPVFFELHSGLERESPGSDANTRRAWRALGPRDGSRVLDIGCGPGPATRELLRCGAGEVAAVDLHLPYLRRLRDAAPAHGRPGAIHPLLADMTALPFADGAFDVLWAEGSIYLMGYERALTEWQRLLRPGGRAAVCDLVWLDGDPPDEVRVFWDEGYPDMTTVEVRADQAESLGWRVVDAFVLPEAAWRAYYDPLERRLDDLLARHAADADAVAALGDDRVEIDMWRRHGAFYGAAFLLLEVRDTG
jgi:SAM-dependent methyltransferase